MSYLPKKFALALEGIVKSLSKSFVTAQIA